MFSAVVGWEEVVPSRERHRQGQGIVKSCDVFGKQNGWDVACVWPRHGKQGDMVSNEEWNHILRILEYLSEEGVLYPETPGIIFIFIYLFFW